MFPVLSITVADVTNSLKRIQELALFHSHEVAHIAEDQLHAEVLAAIADGTCDDPKACAKAALLTERLTFDRGCAPGDVAPNRSPSPAR